uniref:Uncharacterized protein n=1 Tax=Anguilla anguilla TaxID=7936 RepID=A0A0E9TBL5_ANGAN
MPCGKGDADGLFLFRDPPQCEEQGDMLASFSSRDSDVDVLLR